MISKKINAKAQRQRDAKRGVGLKSHKLLEHYSRENNVLSAHRIRGKTDTEWMGSLPFAPLGLRAFALNLPTSHHLTKIFVLHLIVFLALLFQGNLFADEDKAFAKYQEAERASTVEERKKGFNEALALYLQMETDQPSAKLCYNIANTYYQLNEYGYAILYYYKALKENPRFTEAKTNLQLALQKAQVPYESPTFVEDYLLFFHYKLSHNEKALIVLFLLFCAFALVSVHMWVPQQALKKLAIFCLWIALLLFVSLIWADYFIPPEAVVVKPVALRRDAGDQYAPVIGKPALAGTKVTVLSVQPDGNWLKVRLPSGEEGFISKEYARII